MKSGPKTEEFQFVELSEREFSEAHFDCDNFLQSLEMYHRYQELGRECYLVGVKNGQKVLAKGLILARNWHFGKKIFRVAGGWLLDYNGPSYAEILAFLTVKSRDFISQKGGICLEISPNLTAQPRDIKNQVIEGKNHLDVQENLQKLGYKYLGEHEQAKWIFTLDLQGKTPEKVFANFRQNHRWTIRKCDRDGVTVRELKDSEMPIFKQIMTETGIRQGFDDPDIEYYLSMKRAFGDKVKFMLAEREGEPLAVSMFVYEPDEIVYLYSGSVKELQKYSGNYQMQWHMIQEAIKLGKKRYNFYGTHPVEGNGVYLFKQGFRGTMVELLGSFALPIGLLGRLYVARFKPQEFGKIK